MGHGKTKYVVLFGPPGAGKGTQTKVVTQALNLKSLATGEIFRLNLKNNTPLGQLAQKYLEKGELVPDDVTIKMVRETLRNPEYAGGAILDGFPRTMDQARALFEMVQEFDAHLQVILIKVPEEVLVDRISGRILCRKCGKVYHRIFNPPPPEGVACDKGGSCEFYQREDDEADIVANRVHIYLDQTMPLLEYFDRKGVLEVVDGTRGIESVSSDVLAILVEDPSPAESLPETG